MVGWNRLKSRSEGHELLSRRRLEETKSKLRGVMEVAGILSVFTITATVELQINDGDVNEPLLIAFAFSTSILVSLTTLSILISVCILPHVQMLSKAPEPLLLANSKSSQALHERFLRIIEFSCFATNTLAISLFITMTILLCWIKFAYFSLTAPLCATFILAPVLLTIGILAIIFYREFVSHQCELREKRIRRLERMQRNIDLILAKKAEDALRYFRRSPLASSKSFGSESLLMEGSNESFRRRMAGTTRYGTIYVV